MSLSKNADVTTLIDSVEGARNLNNAAREAQICCNVYVEVEIGAGRCGVARGSLHEFMDRVAGFGNIKVTGIMGYGGKIYGMKPGKEMEAQSEKESLLLTEIKRDLESWGYPISIVSAGSSYSSRYPKACRGITESRAGNYIFNDAATLLSGTCEVSDCALRVIATVISKPEKGRFIIDAGSKALSSDLNHYADGYGYVVGFPEMKIYRLNEEHGFVEYKDTDAISIGQKLEIIPNHACVISNLSGEMLGIKDGKVFNIDVSARGMLK
ncbi:MAG: alanine racemase [Bacillota bacterium]|nr:alanine racemase [Bacillota bacterium]